MSSKLELKKMLQARSERVKSVDFHGEQPWLLTALYSGNLSVWDLESQSLIKQVEVSNTPVRAARFLPRHQLIVAGSDDCTLRVYNVFTMERLSQVESAHGDYIRSISVHLSRDLVLTASDDMTIKLWVVNASSSSLALQATYEGHIHYVMQAVWSPAPNSTQFVSGSLDKTLKLWTVNSASLVPASGSGVAALFTLSGHSKGVNAVGYNATGSQVVSGSDDRSVRVWDLHARTCLHVIADAHSNNVTAVAFVPGNGQPMLLSASEDGKIQLWHAATFKRLLAAPDVPGAGVGTGGGGLNYLLDRCWSVATTERPGNMLALGFDEGAVVLRVGADCPVAAVTSAARGRVVFARGAEICALLRTTSGSSQGAASQGVVEEESGKEWTRKELGTSEAGQVQKVVFHPDGRSFVVVSGTENQWMAYSTQAFRVRSFGPGADLVFSLSGGQAGVLDGEGRRLRVLDGESLKEEFAVELDERCEGIFGGRYLGAKFADHVVFLDWTSGEVVGRIEDVQHVAQILWSPQGSTVALVMDKEEKTTYLLRPLGGSRLSAEAEETGTEQEFAVVGEVREAGAGTSGQSVKSAVWVTEDCLLFVASETNRICLSYVGGSVCETVGLSPANSSLHALGVVAGENGNSKVVFMDKDYKVYGLQLDQDILEYKGAIVNEDFQKAQEIFNAKIDKKHHNHIALFLEQHGLPREALEITSDPEHKFNLALTLNALDVALEVCAGGSGNLNKWRMLGDKALQGGNLTLAVKAFEAAEDAESLLLIAATTCEVALLHKTREIANKKKLNHVALYANLLLRDSSASMEILEKENRLAEAALLARTFATDKLPEIFPKWQSKLAKTNEKLSRALKPLHAARALGSPRSRSSHAEDVLLLN